MENNRSKLGLGIAVGSLGLLAILAAIALAVVYTGAYNVAATEEHMSVTRWAFDTTMHQSIKHRAEDVKSSEGVTPVLLAKGASAYKSMCQHCHAGPGVEREKWADGMRPRPPHLVEAAAEWTPGEVIWIVKHGIKMSGMPAFGSTHDEAEIRAIAAFVKELPAMTPERYASFAKDPGHSGTGHKAAAEPDSGRSNAASGSPGQSRSDSTRR